MSLRKKLVTAVGGACAAWALLIGAAFAAIAIARLIGGALS